MGCPSVAALPAAGAAQGSRGCWLSPCVLRSGLAQASPGTSAVSSLLSCGLGTWNSYSEVAEECPVLLVVDGFAFVADLPDTCIWGLFSCVMGGMNPASSSGGCADTSSCKAPLQGPRALRWAVRGRVLGPVWDSSSSPGCLPSLGAPGELLQRLLSPQSLFQCFLGCSFGFLFP